MTSTDGRVEQITQTAPGRLQRTLLAMVGALPGVTVGPSAVCVAGSRGCHLDPTVAVGPPRAFFAGTEFAHLHPQYDGSVHLMLPTEVAEHVIATGWGVSAEPRVSVLVYGPLDDNELVTVWLLVLAAYRQAAPGLIPGTAEGTP